MVVLKQKCLVGIISVCILQCFSQSVVSAEEKSKILKLDLNSCINIALKNYQGMKKAGYEVGIARSRIEEAKSYYWPQLSLQGAYSFLNDDRTGKSSVPLALKEAISESGAYFQLQEDVNAGKLVGYGIPSGTDPDDIIGNPLYNELWDTYKYLAFNSVPDYFESGLLGDRNFIAKVELKQPVFTWGKIRGGHKQAKLNFDIAKSKEKQTAQEIVYGVTNAYYGIVLGKELIELGEKTKIRFEVLRDLTERLYKKGSGKVTKLDYLTVKVYLAEITRQLLEIKGSYNLTKTILKNQLGLAWNTPMEILDKHLPYVPQDINVENHIKMAVGNNPHCEQIRKALKATEMELSIAEHSGYPVFSLLGDYTYISDNEDFLNPPERQWMIGFAASMPFFEGFKSSAKIKNAKESLAKIQSEKILLEEGITSQVKEVSINLDTYFQQINLLEETVKEAEERRILARKSYEVELIDTDEIIDAQILEATTKRGYYQSLYNYNILLAKLRKLVGK
jgi:outer membrane protein TolC